MPPLKEIQRVNVDFTDSMLKELDEIATDVNVRRQAIIKTFLRQALDEYFPAKKSRHG